MEHSCAGTFISSYDMLHITEKLHRKTPTLNHLHERAGLTMMQCILSYRRNSRGHTFSGHLIKPKALYQIPWDKTPLLLFYRLQLTYISGLVQAVTFLPHTPHRHHNSPRRHLLLSYNHHHLVRCSLHLLSSCNHNQFYNHDCPNLCGPHLLQCSSHLLCSPPINRLLLVPAAWAPSAKALHNLYLQHLSTILCQHRGAHLM